ncbi:MAG TPA: hypothetical protein VK447_14765 [Myxococcaceae bacterium]|nr:hypothetical protein [Myxococcaceae bacterium]
MSRFIAVIVAIIAVLAAFVMMSNRASERQEADARALNELRIQRDYLERVGWLRTNPDEASYKAEVSSFFKWYFGEVDAHLTKFGGNKEFDDYLNEGQGGGEGKEGGGKKDAAARKARFDFEKRIFDQMRSGKYAPLWTATDKGMRLDVLGGDVKMVGGRPVVRLETVLWGAQRGERTDGKQKKMVTSASYEVEWKLADEKGKSYGKMTGGDPAMKIDHPERVIKWFPPQMVLGYYELDLLPAEVKSLETSFTVTSRAASGGDARSTFVWKLEPPAEWKLRPGEKWEGAQEMTSTEEEGAPPKKR